MRVSRCFYVLLGLTLCVFQAWCAEICGTEFTDAASSAYLSDIVLEGRVTVTWDSNQYGRYNISIKVSRRRLYKVYKDSSASVQRLLEKSRGVLSVGEFGPENTKACITEITKDSTYMFFLRATESPDYFKVSAFPILASKEQKVMKKLRKSINSVVCKNCAKKPRISKNLKSVSVKEGKKVTLKCYGSGNPKPKIRWEKNGRVLKKVKGMRIKSAKRGMRLQSKRASKRLEGEYTCIVENVIRRVEKVVQIIVISKNDVTTEMPKKTTGPVGTPPRFVPCSGRLRNHCLNNGTCLYSSDIGNHFCQCNEPFSGKRCEYRDLFNTVGPFETKTKLAHERTVIVIGIVIACLVFIVICILSYYLAKQQRVNFYKRREDRKRAPVNESYKPLLLDELDSAPRAFPKRKHSMTTQTDESMFTVTGSGKVTDDGNPIQPVVANHVFASFPSNPPLHLREKPMPTNAQPTRDRLHAVSIDGDNLESDANGKDCVDNRCSSPEDSAENPEETTPNNSPSSLPNEPSFPKAPLPEDISPDGGHFIENEEPAAESSEPGANMEAISSDDDNDDDDVDEEDNEEEAIEAALLKRHPELRVHLHISEEDLSNTDKLPPPPPPIAPPINISGTPEESHGGNPSEGLYEEEDSSSEDSSNSSSSSGSLADGLPAVLSLENHHVKEPASNLSWDEHGTPVISQYACNPYALDMDDDFVNGQLYDQETFRLFGANLESPPPPPTEDILRDLREDQDAVQL